MTYSRLKIMQMACAELPCTLISSPTENSVAAQHCDAFFDIAVAETLQQIKPRFGVVRVALAEVTNDREREWSYAYAMPDDLAYIIAIRPAQEAAVGYELLVGQSLPGYQNAYGMTLPDIRYSAEGGTVYTDQPTAIMEFFTSDVDLATVTPSIAKAIALTLASRICLPVIQDKVRRRELVTETEVWVQRAIADERNQEQQTYDFVPESVMARGGYMG